MSHIYRKITITESSLKLEFSNDDKDPFIHLASISGIKFREEIIQSHIEAIVERMIADKLEVYEEDKKQFSIFDDGEPKGHKAEEDPTDFSADPDGEAVDDFSDVAVPLVVDTQIPDFKRMLSEHAVWYINNHYTGEDGEPGVKDLIQDFMHSMSIPLLSINSLEDTKKTAIERLEF